MVPEQLNHYRIEGPLGQGGMGEVFVAEDTRLHRKVALKVLAGLMAADPERRQRFEREAQAVAAINHPNIVTIHSVEDDGGVPFLTMELVEGRPLSEVLKSGALPVERLLNIGMQVSDAMAAAHQRGIIHRDLKPANVMVGPDWRVKVLDFGLAKLREGQIAGKSEDVTRMPATDLTGEGRIIGTVAYMSPEQAEGKPVDSRSDIFSLGVMLHEMATGEKPFKGETNVSVISSILKDTPSSITDLNPTLPSGLARVIRRALAKDPSRRYQTATDLRNDLEELKQEFDSGITTAMSGVRSGVQRKDRGKRLAVLGVVIAVMTGLAIGVSKWRDARPTRSARLFEAERFTRLTSTGNAFLAVVSPDGRYVAHVKSPGPMPSLWLRQSTTTSDVQIVPPALVRYDGVSFAPEGDYVYYNIYGVSGGVATLYRVPTLGGTPQRVLEDVDSRISFSPDGRRFTFTRGSPTRSTAHVMVANVDGTDVRELASMPSPDLFTNSGPSWSPDGKTILAPATSPRDGPHNLVVAVDVATGKTSVLPGRWAVLGDVEWAPGGGSFVMSAIDFGGSTVAQIWQVSYPSGEARRITNDLNNYGNPTFSADGRSLVTVQAEAISNLWVSAAADPAGGRRITSGRSGRDGLSGLAWTPDGRIVYGAVVGGLPQIWISDADGGNARQLTNESGAVSSLPDVTPDGRYIVFQRFTPRGAHIWRMNVDGSDPKQLTTGGTEQNPHAGEGFVYYHTNVAGSPRPFKVPIDGGQSSQIADQYFRPIEISPDHRRLLGSTWDANRRRSALAILSIEGGTLETVPELPAFGADWMPDGKGLTYWAPEKNALMLFSYRFADRKVEPLAKIPDNLFALAWSSDGKQIVAARGQNVSDVVLITAKETAR